MSKCEISIWKSVIFLAVINLEMLELYQEDVMMQALERSDGPILHQQPINKDLK